jgi:hypothetical protein
MAVLSFTLLNPAPLQCDGVYEKVCVLALKHAFIKDVYGELRKPDQGQLTISADGVKSDAMY